MDKLDLQSKEIVKENIDKIGELFPNVVVESEKGKSIDFDLLKQELTDILIEGNKEKYQLTWPGKKESILAANTPINKTLRPSKEESVDFDKTENIYIEGDNLEVLKLLQESYLNKIKCIYIDPPYNTGNDFIYKDNFKRTSEEELLESGQIDEEGNRLVSEDFMKINPSSQGRYHSDWLSMIYSRLKLARNLLTDDGMIFISIDEHEQSNLKKICDEIFGESSFLAEFIWQTKNAARGVPPVTMVMNNHEYILAYSKNGTSILKGLERNEEDFSNPDNDSRGLWRSESIKATGKQNNFFEIEDPKNGKKYSNNWAFSKTRLAEMINDNLILFPDNDLGIPRQKKFINSYINDKKAIVTSLGWFSTENATKALMNLFDEKKFFDFSKPLDLIKFLIEQGTNSSDIIMDFFSGSATTAHSIMQINAEDGGKRKYIMVQLPELTIEKSEPYIAGYKNICEIGKERIRRAGQKIKEETGADIDYGFRVYKLDSSNMKDVYYNPNNLAQEQLNLFESNIKEDRTSDDLLTQVLIDLGLELSLKIEGKIISHNKVYFVEDNSLVACFDEKISMDVIDEIAKYNPLKLVFRDSSFDDNSKINVSERMKRLSPETIIKII